MFRGKEITKDDFEALKQNTRRTLLAPVLLQLQQQSRLGLAPQIAEVFGEVKHPWALPYNPTYDDFYLNRGCWRLNL